MSSGWQLRDMRLKFGLGDWTAFSVPLKLHARSVRLGERLAPAEDPTPPTEPPLQGAAGYMLRALPVAAPLPRLTLRDGWLRYVTLQYPHCYIDLSIGMEAYRAKFSSKTRQTIARKVRKFEEHSGGTIDWRTYRTPEEMREFHRHAREVSALTYQERLLDAGIPGDAPFVEQMLAAAARDEARGWLLFDHGRPVSYLYCPAEAGALVYAYLGYDPGSMKLSVGTVLQWLAVEQLYAEGRFGFFDFTEGQSEHKRLFATHELRCANVIFVRRTVIRALIVRLHAASERFSSALGALAERWGVKARLKRWMRFGVAGARP
ncbi:MAG: GNAT family N-acetyltransferase [Rubrivivax sp.]|nr:GNAT family N-acetyltransferase [Rubrivivax sp.]